MIDINQLEQNFLTVEGRITEAALRVGRNPDDVCLVVVSKGRSIEEINFLYELGMRDFGENRIEQAALKIDALRDMADIRWHMIGHVQSRKAKDVCQLFDMIHSLDNLKLAARLDRFAFENERILPVLLQFNVSGEESKSGWSIVDEFKWDEKFCEIEEIMELKNIRINGLMTMAPYDINPENARPYFERLVNFKEHLKNAFPEEDLSTLSMGMSGDFEVAVEEGANIVRVGSAIFDD